MFVETVEHTHTFVSLESKSCALEATLALIKAYNHGIRFL